MKVIDGFWEPPTPNAPTVLTFGRFDALHIGHQAIFRRVVDHARKTGRLSAVLFLEPHPMKLIDPTRCPPTLTRLSKKLELLDSFGFDLAVIARFDDRMRGTEASSFIEQMARGFHVAHLVIGYQARFGHRGQGTTDTLVEHAEPLGYTVETVGAQEYDGEVVSSTRVRLAVEAGELDLAETLLGRRYSVTGEVVKGDQRGRELGYPTANVEFGDQQLPPLGIYAARTVVDGVSHDSAVSLGVRPTFQGDTVLLESYLLDFSGDLYGKTVEVVFIEKLRDELRFDSLDALVKQIDADVEQTRRILA
ncbi:MAG: bifunctional riboflavin kinase/FAD synthetase [Candidatus Poribacteria bacterium]|nr:bifunctional riboflavin kinase/FAD synthetase [Candidatus Poribacteria bacterium]